MEIQRSVGPIMGTELEKSLSATTAATTEDQQARSKGNSPRLRWKAAAVAVLIAFLTTQRLQGPWPKFGDRADESIVGGACQEWWDRSNASFGEAIGGEGVRPRNPAGAENFECQTQRQAKGGKLAEAHQQEGARLQGMATRHQEHPAGGKPKTYRNHGQAQEGFGEGRRGHCPSWRSQCGRGNGLWRGHFGRRVEGQEALFECTRQQDGRVQTADAKHADEVLPAGISKPAALSSDVRSLGQGQCSDWGDNVTSHEILTIDELPLQGHPGQYEALQAERQESQSGPICDSGRQRLEGGDKEFPGRGDALHIGGGNSRSGRNGREKLGALGVMTDYFQGAVAIDGSATFEGNVIHRYASGQTSSLVSAPHQAEGHPDDNLSSDVPWWCTGSCDFNSRQPLHLEFSHVFYQFYFATTGFFVFRGAPSFRDLPDAFRMLLILAIFLAGWSLILVAHYFPWQTQRVWILLTIRKRRYFVEGLPFFNDEGALTLRRCTRFKRNLQAALRWRWRLTWAFLCLLVFPTEAMQNLQNAQLPLDIFTPPDLDNSAAASNGPGSDYNPFKDIVVHRLDRVPDYFRMPTALPPWRTRSFIGRQLGLEKKEHHWENFNVYQVQPHPNGVRSLTELHYLLELPNDKLPSESMILVEKRQLTPAVFIQRFAWRVQTSLSRTEFLDEIGSTHECGRNYAECLVFLLGELWPENDVSLRVLPNGALLKVIYSLEDELEHESPSQSSCHNGVDQSGSLADTVDYSDDNSLMQRSVHEFAQRNAEDAVFRLLSGRLAFRHLPHGYGYTISLWATHERNTPQTIETRVWLDANIQSWEERSVYAIGVSIPGIRERHPRWLFYVATPSPFTERISNNNVQLLCIPESYQDVVTLLLVDIFNPHQLRRVAIALTEPTSVLTLATILVHARVEELESFSFQLSWSTRDGDLILHDHDIIRFPFGAYVRLSRIARPRNDDACTLLQTSLSLSSASSALRLQKSGGLLHFHNRSTSTRSSEVRSDAPATNMPVILWSHSLPMSRMDLKQQTSILLQTLSCG